MANWSNLQQLILSDQYKYLSRIVWEDFAIITDRRGYRFKITDRCSFLEVQNFLEEIKNVGYGYSFIQKNITNIVMLSFFSFIFTLN